MVSSNIYLVVFRRFVLQFYYSDKCYFAFSSDLIIYQRNNYFQGKMDCEKSPSPAGSLDSGLGWSPIFAQNELAAKERNVLRYSNVIKPSEVDVASYKHEERQQSLSPSQSSTISGHQYFTKGNLSIGELALNRKVDDRSALKSLSVQTLRHQVYEGIFNCTKKKINSLLVPRFVSLFNYFFKRIFVVGSLKRKREKNEITEAFIL